MAPPKSNPFSRKTATTYALVHRPQHDPLIHDSDAPSQVFAEISGPSTRDPELRSSKVKQRGDLEQEFGLSGAVRDNEGEAAEHGVFFDDSNYDYMQHMRDLGQAGGEVAWVEAPAPKGGKGKGKAKLEDALRDMGLDDDNASEMQSQGGRSAFSNAPAGFGFGREKDTRYQAQQDLPDELAGFQPDMDPRLREVLEALDDEAYVDDEDDIFTELAGKGAEEVDPNEWEAQRDDEDEGWESDDTTKPVKEYNTTAAEAIPKGLSKETPTLSPSDAINLPPSPPSAPSEAFSTASALGRRKKRKGARTSSTGFSMTSSSIARTDALSTLDSRFDRVLDSYLDNFDEEDEDGLDSVSMASGMTGMSKASGMSGMSRASGASWATGSGESEAPSLTSAGFDSVMDEFLGGNTGPKKGRLMRKGGQAAVWGGPGGMAQLDEIRKGLGPARLQKERSGGVRT